MHRKTVIDIRALGERYTFTQPIKELKTRDLAERVGITPANLSILKTGKAKAIRFSTLEAICKELGCQPGDILEYVPD